MGPLSSLWKGLEFIRKAPSDKVVEVPVDKFDNILKMIMKDPRKA